MLNFALLDNHFSDLFTEVQIWHLETFKLGPERFFRKIKQISAKNNFLTSGTVNKDISKIKFCRQ